MKKQILSLIPALLTGANIFAATPTAFVLKWNISIATPGRKGLVTLAPGTTVTLERGRTNDVFAILGITVPKAIPESEEAHRALSIEFRYRFFKKTITLVQGSIRADKHGVFIPAHQSTGKCDPYKPADQELYSTESLTVPTGADSLEIERVATDTLSGKKKASGPALFALVGNSQSLLVASGDSRGDEKAAPPPIVLGAPITASKPFSFVFDEYRAMNAWVRTEVSKLYGEGIVASYSGADSRTITCINKDPKKVYYSAWADIPLFEISTRVRFDQGDWQEFPVKRLHPAWAPGLTKNLFPAPFDNIPGIFRSASHFTLNKTATVFPQTASGLASLHLQSIPVPTHARTVSMQTRIHAFLIAHYGKNFEGASYVGDDCIKIYADGQRVELGDLWDSPDFTPRTSWTFPVN